MMDNKKDNKEKQKSTNLRKTFQPLPKQRKRELKKLIQNPNTYQHGNNGSTNNKSSTSLSPHHSNTSITYYGRSIKSRVSRSDILNLKKELQSIASSFFPTKRRGIENLFKEVEGDYK